jgi:hypothetical protein
MLLGREPVAFLSAFGAIVALLVGFGLPVTPAQVGLIMAAVHALLGLLARANVSPVTPGVSAVPAVPLSGWVEMSPAVRQILSSLLTRP